MLPAPETAPAGTKKRAAANSSGLGRAGPRNMRRRDVRKERRRKRQRETEREGSTTDDERSRGNYAWRTRSRGTVRKRGRRKNAEDSKQAGKKERSCSIDNMLRREFYIINVIRN